MAVHIETLTNTFPLNDSVHCLSWSRVVTRLVADLEAFARDLSVYVVSRRKLCNPLKMALAASWFLCCVSAKIRKEWYLRKGKNTPDQGGRELFISRILGSERNAPKQLFYL